MQRREFFLSLGAAMSAAGVELSKIQLGVTTDEIDDDIVTASQFLKEFHLRFAEVRTIWGKYNTVQPVDKIRECKSIFDQHGIRTSVLGTAFFKIPLPPDTPQGRAVLDNQWSLLDGAMERAKILGTDKIRTFAFTYEKGYTPTAKDYERIYELEKESARRAKARGFRLAIENVGGSFVQTGAEAAELLKHVKEDSIGLTWDPNNAGAVGERSFPDGYKKLDPARIMHVHLRDFRYKDGKGEWTAVGEGQMDNLGQIRALLKDGYKGSWTLETHYKSPQGKAHASRTSLTALLKVIQSV
ncbi:MAG: sugar phosphate isomerase/epimerase family protein [Bryobacteraceae bacterium]